jgi:hypothetical protein
MRKEVYSKYKPRVKKVVTPDYMCPGTSIPKHIYGVVVCVNFSDYLGLSLEMNHRLLDTIFVVTDTKDEDTASLCKEYSNVECIRTDCFYEEGCTFDKGKGLNEAIRRVPQHRDTWVLVYDSDIVLPLDFRKHLDQPLDTAGLYGAPRHFAYYREDYDAFVAAGRSDYRMLKDYYSPGDMPIGFFQLFHSSRLYLPEFNPDPYPEHHNDASYSDLVFAKKFDDRSTLKHIHTIHLGHSGVNHRGRVTPKFQQGNHTVAPDTSDKGFFTNSRRMVNNVGGKLNIRNQVGFNVHRSGWNYAVEALLPLHHEKGVMFDGFLEKNFFDWDKTGSVVYTQPWVGILHFPPRAPGYFGVQNSSDYLFRTSVQFRKSLECCKGLYTLSQSHKKAVDDYGTGIPVQAMLHPTETPDLKFSIEAYELQETKTLVQVGWWLRRLSSIYRINVPKGFTKYRLVPDNDNRSTVEYITHSEMRDTGLVLNEDIEKSVGTLQGLSNEEYDQLLSKSVCFVDLYESSANNTVIECIVRGTPLLVNRLPSVEEYLGTEYPLFFNDFDDAYRKLENHELILRAHDYLLNYCPTRDKLTQQYFREQLEQGYIYKTLNK